MSIKRDIQFLAVAFSTWGIGLLGGILVLYATAFFRGNAFLPTCDILGGNIVASLVVWLTYWTVPPFLFRWILQDKTDRGWPGMAKWLVFLVIIFDMLLWTLFFAGGAFLAFTAISPWIGYAILYLSARRIAANEYD